MKTLVVLIFCLFSSVTYAETLSCGSSQAVVLNSEQSSFPYFGLAIFNSNYQISHKFDASNDFFKLKCVEDVKGKPYFLVKSTCGGTSCMENFALIDTSNGQIVVEADKPRASLEDYDNPEAWGNHKEIEKVLGRTPKYFSCEIREVNSKEICMVSKVELG